MGRAVVAVAGVVPEVSMVAEDHRGVNGESVMSCHQGFYFSSGSMIFLSHRHEKS